MIEMKVLSHTITIQTSSDIELIDITNNIEEFVKKSGIKKGIVVIFVPHATAAIILEERESGLIDDIINKIKKEFPKGAGYKHDKIDDNAHSHIGSCFIGQEKTLLIQNGNLIRGMWQSIQFVELDGPRAERKIIIQIVGK